MGALLWAALGVVAGACIAVQAPINAELGRLLGMPFAAAMVSFAAGALVLALLSLAVAGMGGTTVVWHAPPLWTFVAGGALGTVYVTSSIVLTPRIGAAAVMALSVAGQLIAGLVLDHYGLLGLPSHEVSAGRFAGALLLVAGVVMIRVL